MSMEVPQGDTYYFKFTTRAFATGIPTTLAGTPVISVYEENNLTQITTGVSITVDYDSVTGMHEVAIVATSGNGYEVGKYYNAVITTGTVGGVSVVGETIGHFRCMPSEDAGAGIKDVNTTHVSDTAQTGNDNGADINTLINGVSLNAGAITNASLAGNMEIVFETDFATNYNTTRNAWVTNYTDVIGTGGWNVGKTGYSLTATTGLGNQTSNITGNLSGSVGSVTGAAGSVTGAVGSVAGNVDGNVTGSVGSNLELGPSEVNAQCDIAISDADIATETKQDVIDTNVDSILADTNELQGDWTDGGRLDLIIDSIQTEVLKITTTAQSEPTGVPAANEAPIDKLAYLFMALRNQVDVTATKKTFYDDGGSAEWEKDLSDDLTTYSESEANAI